MIIKIQAYISISYSKIDGMPVEKNLDFFAWFGNMDLVSHAWKFLGLGPQVVDVSFTSREKFHKFRKSIKSLSKSNFKD